MFRYLIMGLVLFACCAALACQSYSTGMQQSVTKADETAAISALHSISVAQRTYSLSNSGSYGTFEQLVQAGLLDERFKADKPKVKGYVLTMSVTSKAEGAPDGSYSVNADPEGSGPQAAGRHLYIDSTSGLIHLNATQPATASDQSLDQ
jgi:Tfp pilus assembly protein PilE